jgi:hypothetical protein
MKCEGCNADIPDESTLCGNCGGAVQSRDAEADRSAPRVPDELVRDREGRAAAALQMERARVEVEREGGRSRRAFMIGVFVFALLASVVVTVVISRLGVRNRPAPRPSAQTPAPVETERAGIEVRNIRLARGRDERAVEADPVNILRLGLDKEVYCFFEVVGGSGEVPLSVEWWWLGTMEHRVDVTVDLGPPAASGTLPAPARRAIALQVPALSEAGMWELRFKHNGRLVGALPIRVQQTLATGVHRRGALSAQ